MGWRRGDGRRDRTRRRRALLLAGAVVLAGACGGGGGGDETSPDPTPPTSPSSSTLPCPADLVAPLETRPVEIPGLRPEAEDVVAPIDAGQASLILQVTGASDAMERVRAKFDGATALDVDLPPRRDGCGADPDPVFSYGYEMPARTVMVSVRAHARSTTLNVEVPATGTVWVLARLSADDPPIALTASTTPPDGA